MNTRKKAYQSPQLTVHGDVVEITQGNHSGNSLDKSFPIGTPHDLLTFS